MMGMVCVWDLVFVKINVWCRKNFGPGDAAKRKEQGDVMHPDVDKSSH